MKLTCYVPDCKNASPNIPFWKYLWLALKWRDRRFYVCPEHYDLFRQEDTFQNIVEYWKELKQKYPDVSDKYKSL